jgi:2-hydroxy-3-keto-5-methylthiopentenyl-1-phosphate phosphatase
MASPLAVFCDMDGTFLVQDVGSTLVRRYAGGRRPDLWARYERGELTAWEYNMEIIDGLMIPPDELEAFLRSVELDPGAADLVRWCDERDVPFRVLTDGFDYTVTRIRELSGVPFEFDANHLWVEDGGVLRIAAGFLNPNCHCGTGTCKRGRIEAFRVEHPGVEVVHIGNGAVSDLCGAEAADLAFAKDTLAEELRRRGMAFESFTTLHDVIAELDRRWPGLQSIRS